MKAVTKVRIGGIEKEERTTSQEEPLLIRVGSSVTHPCWARSEDIQEKQRPH